MVFISRLSWSDFSFMEHRITSKNYWLDPNICVTTVLTECWQFVVIYGVHCKKKFKMFSNSIVPSYKYDKLGIVMINRQTLVSAFLLC